MMAIKTRTYGHAAMSVQHGNVPTTPLDDDLDPDYPDGYCHWDSIAYYASIVVMSVMSFSTVCGIAGYALVRFSGWLL